jgi:hypothetical protein
LRNLGERLSQVVSELVTQGLVLSSRQTEVRSTQEAVNWNSLIAFAPMPIQMRCADEVSRERPWAGSV